SLIAGSDVASAGKLQMIGFESIRERLGQRWARSREQICSFLEAELASALGPGDVFFRLDDLAYIVLLANRSIAESKLLCAKIAQDVCRRFFGDEDDLVRVRNLICNAESALISEDVSIEDALDSMLETEGEEQIFNRQTLQAAPAAALVHAVTP